MAHTDARSCPDADLKRRSVLAEYGLLPDGPDSVAAAEVPDAAGDTPSASAARALNFLVDLAAADREKVLEPLVRLHRPGDAPGSGLGLATCVRIMNSHGGELSITDTPGGGTTVSALFPETGQFPEGGKDEFA